MKKLISIVIRTLNEDLYLEELLESIKDQKHDDFEVETVVIDSGSSDRTIEIAKIHDARLTYIEKEKFTFGRSLNMGSDFANGDILVYISGHCVPTNRLWLNSLVKPIIDGDACYTYGRQVGRDTTKFSERKIFEKYFPSFSKIPQEGFFCNNANSAIERKVWLKYKFNESITGLEDMEIAKRMTENGYKIGYVSDASVFHIHNESWSQTKRRYEREAIALKKIMPDIHITIFDCTRYITASIISDANAAYKKGYLFKEIYSIFKFRIAQYFGSYKGNHENRRLSKKRKELYFYPKN